MASVAGATRPALAQRTRAALRRVPTILQLEAVECGAACLAMVLAHHGRHVPLETLRTACGVTRDGAKAGGILRAARGFGMVARGFKKEPAALADLPMPAVLFWNFNHFVVLESVEPAGASINDPALGRRVVGPEEFDEAFTGVVLTFEPGPDFSPGGQAPSVLRSLSKHVEGLSGAIAVAVVIGLALVVPGITLPWLIGRFIDDVLAARLPGLAETLLIGLVLAGLARGALSWLQGRVLTEAFTRTAVRSATRFVAHALTLPMDFFVQRSPGEVAARVALNDRIAETVSADLAHLLLDLVTAVFFLGLMVRLDPGLAVVAILCVAAQAAALRAVDRRTDGIAQRLSVQSGRLAGLAAGGLSNIESIKAGGQESALFQRWLGLQVQLANTAVEAQRATLLLMQVPTAAALAASLVVLGVGTVRILAGTFSVGDLVAFQVLLAGFVAPVHALFGAARHLQTLRGDTARVDDVLNARADVEVATTEAAAVASPTSLSFDRVAFGYTPGGEPLVSDFSLTIGPGQRVALVGASGSGKSTLARLAAGLYHPWSGTVCFDGRPRSEWPRETLARAVAYVDQDVVLFAGSVRENLALWATDVRDEQILDAMRDAGIEKEMTARAGLDAPLEEGARNLSGGQRQRLEIARALARSPSILILDEATSALDPATEALVEENLRRRRLACLVIAHRLSTVRDADEILVLDRGVVMERGTHAELMAKPGGRYAALVAGELAEGND